MVRTLLPELRERVRQIGRSSGIHGVLPFGVAAIDRVLPGGGLARGALHEILGMGGDEEDGALAAAFAAHILGCLTRPPTSPSRSLKRPCPSLSPLKGGDGKQTSPLSAPGGGEGRGEVGVVLWCLPRPDLYGPGLAAHGLDPGRVVLVRASRDAEILWAMEEGLRAPGIVAVVGEVGTLPMVASRRLQLAAERSGILAFLLRRWRDGGQAARERALPNAAVTRWRIAALPSRPQPRRARSRASAVARRAAALPRRRAGMLGNGGAGCDGSCISGCRAGRSTGGACRSRKNSAEPAEEAPFATVADAAGRRLLAAVNPAATAAGLAPGMPLADALSFLPGLATALAKPAEDAAALRRLAEWCGRYSPWTAPDGADGVRIEITGSAHLWGGETALAADLAARLDRRGIASRIVIADTLGAAWAIARFAETSDSVVILASGKLRAALASLPVEALRLDQITAQGLRRVGLKRVGDLYAMPRDALARRFGETVARLLDQALDEMSEPLSPLGEVPSRRVRLSFVEPITEPADLMLAAERLTADLVLRLAREGTGARRLDLGFYRVDGRVERIRLGTARPSRDPRHLAALFKERLDTIDPGLGIEDMILAAYAVESLPAEQIGLPGHTAGPHPTPPPLAGEGMGGGIAPLLDRLGNRLGLAAISRLEPRESHIPERASVRVSVNARKSKTRFYSPLPPLAGGQGLRPIRLFDPPEPVEAFWLLPDDPPFRFTWRRRRHRVMRADGPERIADEWWRPEGYNAVDAIRDYYRVEDEEGRRFWLYRAGLHGSDRKPRWFIHGVFS